MNRIRLTRKAFGHTVEHVATELGLSAQTVKTWESGRSAPTHAQLRDLAMLYGTSVGDLVGEDSLKERAVRTWHLRNEEGIDGYWGELGVMLPNTTHYRWRSISTASAAAAEMEIGRRDALDDRRRSAFFDTLNGHLLWINLTAVKCVSLCHEGNEWPEPYASPEASPGRRQMDLEAHPSQILPLVAYEVLAEYARNDEWSDDVSVRLRQYTETFIEDRSVDLSDDDLRRLLLSVRVWMTDGSTLWIDASSASMSEAVTALALDDAAGLVRLMDDDEGFVSQAIPLDQVAMLEFPVALLRWGE